MPISRTFSAVGITSGSFWKPSRGPTSRIRTSLGKRGHGSSPPRPGPAITRRSWVPTPIVRSPSRDLDVEAELAVVDDLA